MANQTDNQAMTLLSIESLINSHDEKLSTLKKESTVYKEMIKDLLENDEEFSKLSEQVAKLNKLKTLARLKVMKSSAAATTVEKLKDLQTQTKELKVALSDYLSQYVGLAGTNQFEGSDGVTRQIIYTARLVKKLEG